VAGRPRRVARRGPKDQLWTILVIDGLVVDDSPAVSRDIVEGADWAVGGGFEHGTILRVRGWLTLQPPAAVPSTMFMTIGPQDQVLTAGNANPTLEATYLDEDILWTYGVSVAATVANDLYIPPIIVDIKAMRKITTGVDLRLTMVTNGPVGAGWTINGVLRALVRRGGN